MNTTHGNLNTITEARKRLGGIGVSTIYSLMRAGQIKAIKIGSRSFISDAEIERFLTDADAAAGAKLAARQVREPA